jgi:hypothetical protein
MPPQMECQAADMRERWNTEGKGIDRFRIRKRQPMCVLIRLGRWDRCGSRQREGQVKPLQEGFKEENRGNADFMKEEEEEL